MANAYILYKENEQETISITDFKKFIVKYLISNKHQTEILEKGVVAKKISFTQEINRKEGTKLKKNV